MGIIKKGIDNPLEVWYYNYRKRGNRNGKDTCRFWEVL